MEARSTPTFTSCEIARSAPDPDLTLLRRDPVDHRYATVRLFRDDEEIDALLVPELGSIPASRILCG